MGELTNKLDSCTNCENNGESTGPTKKEHKNEFLPELDRKLTQKAVENAFEKYRLYKFITFEDKEGSITAGAIDPQKTGFCNTISDQTSAIATFNVDTKDMRRRYCDRIERIVERMPALERTLLKERYMSSESEYITDQNVYSFKFNPPISRPTYEKIRWKAFYKLALDLDIAVETGGKNG